MRMRDFINIITEAMSLAQATQIFRRHGIDPMQETDDDLKKKYRKLVQKLHPDRPGGDEEAIKDVNAAYDTIKATRANTGGPMHPSSGGSARGQRASRTDADTTWAWAGHSGGMPPSADYNPDLGYLDINFVKKRMWELSGKSREEWHVQAFDGSYFRGSFTVYRSKEIIPEMAKAMLKWDRFFQNRAVFATPKTAGPNELWLVWVDGIELSEPVVLTHDSFNANPGNDQRFVRKLPDMLDQIAERERNGGSKQNEFDI